MTQHPFRRQEFYGAHTIGVVNTMPLALTLAAAHSSKDIAVSLGSCRGGSSSSRNRRRRGSPFAALSDAYKPPRTWLSPNPGRGGGEVVPVRSSIFVWPERLNPAAADPRKLPRDISVSPAAVGVNTDDTRKDEQRSAHAASVTKEEKRTGDTKNAKDAEHNTPSTQTDSDFILTSGHKRRVTWSGAVETKEVIRERSSDIFSPDLLSLEVAKQLAVLTKEPELARIVEAITATRRRAASIIRSLSARDDWNGSLDGVEDACRAWTLKEGAYLREMDELVRQAVYIGDISDLDGDKPAKNVWGLKATYREARRRMEDAESD